MYGSLTSSWLLGRKLLSQRQSTPSHSLTPVSVWITFIATAGLCRPGVGNVPSVGERPMADLGLLVPALGWPSRQYFV